MHDCPIDEQIVIRRINESVIEQFSANLFECSAGDVCPRNVRPSNCFDKSVLNTRVTLEDHRDIDAQGDRDTASHGEPGKDMFEIASMKYIEDRNVCLNKSDSRSL